MVKWTECWRLCGQALSETLLGAWSPGQPMPSRVLLPGNRTSDLWCMVQCSTNWSTLARVGRGHFETSPEHSLKERAAPQWRWLYQSCFSPGWGATLPSSTSSLLVSAQGGKKRNICKGHSPGTQATKRLKLNRKIIECSLPPHHSSGLQHNRNYSGKAPRCRVHESRAQRQQGDKNKDIRGLGAPGT